MTPTPFGDGLWLLDGDRVVMWGLVPFETRMTIIRQADGGLWIHSPVKPSFDRVAAVRALGPIRRLVAPNKIHGLYIADWAKAAPEAEVWVSPGFAARHPKIAHDHTLGDAPPAEWAEEIDQLVFAGHSFLDEVVFFHRRSRTLILTDLIQRHDPAKESFLYRALKRWGGVLGEEGGVARDLRNMFTDRAAARRSYERMMGWPFERVVISHGFLIERDAKATVARAFDWLVAEA